MRDSDGPLLKSFATDRDEEAFRLLTERHLGLIFHTALRRTGNRPLAEEISQNVLLAMARKSGTLARNPELLPAWLHRATLFESSKAMRTESNYQRRKGKFGSSGDNDISPEEADAVWRNALPHLDPAMDQLSEADRGILLLHYFEGQPFPQIAERLGKNLAAVQKQSQRALEKLSRILRAKGVALSVTALGTGLAANTAKAVPEALVHSACNFAIAGSTLPLTFPLTAMIASKSKVVTPLAVLLLAAPLVLQQLAIAHERERIQSLRNSLASSAKAASAARHNSVHVSNSTLSGSIDIMVLAEEEADAKRIGGETRRQFVAKLESLDTDILAELIRKAGAAPLGVEKKIDLLGSLLGTISERAPGRGVIAAVQGLPQGTSMENMIFQTGVDILLSKWAGKDSAAAIAWFREVKDLAKLNARTRSGFDGSVEAGVRGHLEIYLLNGLIKSESPDAVTYLNSLPEIERIALIERTITQLKVLDMQDQFPDGWLPPYLQIVRDGVPESKRERIIAKLSAGTDWKRLPRVLAGAGASAAETAILARAVAQDALAWEDTYRWQWDKKEALDPGVLQCMEELVPGRGQEVLAEARLAADRDAFQKASDTLSRVRAGSALTEDQLYWMLTKETDLSTHIAEALELTERIQNTELRQKAIDFLSAKANSQSTR